MSGFVGREAELGILTRHLRRVEDGGRTGRPGKALLVQGRRRVGKSRLVEEFVERAGVPALFFTAAAPSGVEADLQSFVEAAAASTLPGASLMVGQAPRTWDAALSLLASVLPQASPAVVVLDEMPYLIRNDPGFEGALQKVFDRELARLPVLLIGIGSDLAMMEALDSYGRPFHQRATEMVVVPLRPSEVAAMVGLDPADAIDAYLVSGGLPMVLDEWPDGESVADYLSAALDDPTSALIVSGERALAAEFPVESQARRVLGAIGAGERSFSSLARAAAIPHASLVRSLDLLTAKRVVETSIPLSVKASRETRYAVADPHLRFWLAFVAPYQHEIDRGRGDLTLARWSASWTSWRGRAVEPVVREALRRMPDRLPDGTTTIGGFWTRTNDPEIDLVGADRSPASAITFLGSVKWLEERPFDVRDLTRLSRHRDALPGAHQDTPLVVVSRSGVADAVAGAALALSPADLVDAY